jgi:hypothetical protein
MPGLMLKKREHRGLRLLTNSAKHRYGTIVRIAHFCWYVPTKYFDRLIMRLSFLRENVVSVNVANGDSRECRFKRRSQFRSGVSAGL